MCYIGSGFVDLRIPTHTHIIHIPIHILHIYIATNTDPRIYDAFLNNYALGLKGVAEIWLYKSTHWTHRAS